LGIKVETNWNLLKKVGPRSLILRKASFPRKGFLWVTIETLKELPKGLRGCYKEGELGMG